MFYLIRYKVVNNTNVYCSVSGNLGKIFAIIFIAIARLKMMKIFVITIHFYIFTEIYCIPLKDL